MVLSNLTPLNVDDVADFLLRNAPAVINIAGNSLSKISKQIEDDICAFLIKSLRRYSFLKVAPKNIALCDDIRNDHITVAVPNFGVSKEIFKDFFKCAYNDDIRYSKQLVIREAGFTLVLARPREIIKLVENGVDIGFVGQDLCEEYSYNGEILLQTGLIPNATVLVSKKAAVDPTDSICSQYPAFAEKLLNRPAVPITGSAEAYLGMDIFDACVDSYQTGDTVAQNNLHVVKKLSESSLVMLGGECMKGSYFYSKFVLYLQGKL